LVFLVDVSHLVEFLLDFLSFFLSRQLFLSGEKSAYFLVKVIELLFEIVVFLLLVRDVVFPVDEFKVGSLDVLLELLGLFDCHFDLYVDFLLFYLLFKSSELCFQDLIFRFELVNFLDFGLIAVVLLVIVVYGKRVVGFGSIV
jgi:hypothetical protein